MVRWYVRTHTKMDHTPHSGTRQTRRPKNRSPHTRTMRTTMPITKLHQKSQNHLPKIQKHRRLPPQTRPSIQTPSYRRKKHLHNLPPMLLHTSQQNTQKTTLSHILQLQSRMGQSAIRRSHRQTRRRHNGKIHNQRRPPMQIQDNTINPTRTFS